MKNEELRSLMRQLPFERLDIRFLYQSAPVLLGIKASNLVTIRPDEQNTVLQWDHVCGLEERCLYENERRSVFLLYRKPYLYGVLESENSKYYLSQLGYSHYSMDAILGEIAGRYSKAMEENRSFPHEIGVLLGYPIDDVVAFEKERGQNSLLVGEWSVYQDVENAKKWFSYYEEARAMVLELVRKEITIRQILNLNYFHKI